MGRIKSNAIVFVAAVLFIASAIYFFVNSPDSYAVNWNSVKPLLASVNWNGEPEDGATASVNWNGEPEDGATASVNWNGEPEDGATASVNWNGEPEDGATASVNWNGEPEDGATV